MAETYWREADNSDPERDLKLLPVRDIEDLWALGPVDVPEQMHKHVRCAIRLARRGELAAGPGNRRVIAFLNTAAEVVGDLAILTAAAVAFLGFLLGASTKVVTQGGSVVVWRLPLFRRVRVVGQARRPLSAHDVVEDSETGAELVGEAATADATKAGAGDENPPVSGSAWFHVPAAIDRSRDPVELPAIALRRTSRNKRKRLHLRAESVDTELVGDPPSIRIDVSGDQSPGSGVELSEPDAGRLRGALVGTWISTLWS